MKNIILDAALGRDSYFAAMAAIRSEKLHLAAITVGDVKMDRAVHGMLHLLMHMYLDIPVCKGINCGLTQLTEEGHSTVPDPFAGQWPEDVYCTTPAVEKMAELVGNHPGKTTILTHSTLTNVAQFLLRYPQLKEKIEEITILENRAAGSAEGGFPFDPPIDPEAANVIFSSGVRVYFIPYDAMTITDENRESIEKVCTDPENIICRFLHHANIQDAGIYVTCGIGDVIAVTDKGAVTAVPATVRAETQGEKRGTFTVTEEECGTVLLVKQIDYSVANRPGFGLVDTMVLRQWEAANAGRNAHHHG